MSNPVYFAASISYGFIQLSLVHRIGGIGTISDISDGFSAGINAVFCNGRTIIDGDAVIINNGISRLDAAIMSQIQILRQTNFQIVRSVGHDSNVIRCSQFACITDSANDVHLVVQFLFDDISGIAAVLHAVIQGGYLVFSGLVFIDNTGDAVFAVYTGRAFGAVGSVIAVLHGNIHSVGAVFSVCPGRSRKTDMTYAVFAVNGYRIFAVFSFDGNAVIAVNAHFSLVAFDRDSVFSVNAYTGYAVFTVDAHVSVFAVSTGFSDGELITEVNGVFFAAFRICSFCYGQVFIHSGFNCGVFSGFGSQIGNIVFNVGNILGILGNRFGIFAYFPCQAVELAAVYSIGAVCTDFSGCHIDNLPFLIFGAYTDNADRITAGKVSVVSDRSVRKGDGAFCFFCCGTVNGAGSQSDGIFLCRFRLHAESRGINSRCLGAEPHSRCIGFVCFGSGADCGTANTFRFIGAGLIPKCRRPAAVRVRPHPIGAAAPAGCFRILSDSSSKSRLISRTGLCIVPYCRVAAACIYSGLTVCFAKCFCSHSNRNGTHIICLCFVTNSYGILQCRSIAAGRQSIFAFSAVIVVIGIRILRAALYAVVMRLFSVCSISLKITA